MSTTLTARNPSEAAEDLIQRIDSMTVWLGTIEPEDSDMYEIFRKSMLAGWVHEYVSEVMLSTGAYFSLGKDKGIYLDIYAGMDMKDETDDLYGKQVGSLKAMFNQYIEDENVERGIFVDYLRSLADEIEMTPTK